GADRLQLGATLRRVRRLDRRVGIEAGALGRPPELAVGGDVLALAEERLVQRVLQLAQAALLARPQARAEGQGRARLVAREVDLDPALERAAVDVPGPVGAQMVAANLEQRTGCGPQLERQPLDLDGPRVLRRLHRERLHVRVRTDDVVVEPDPGHANVRLFRLAPRCGSQWPSWSRSSPRRSGISTPASRGTRGRRRTARR